MDDRESFVDGGRFGRPGFAGFQMELHGEQDAEELPHSQVTLVFQFGDAVRIGGVDAACDARAVVIGLNELPTPTRSSGTINCVEVRISPVDAFRLFGGRSMHDFSGRPTDLRDVIGSRIDDVVEQAGEASDWETKFQIVDSLLRSLRTERRTSAEVEEAWSMIVAAGGQVTMQELSTQTGWSTNRLRKRFAAQIGLPPKRAARLVRFDRAHGMLAAGMSPIDTAVACGFADQSHLHREVRAFANSTPGGLAIGNG
jgi:AraC-like DNA-binding protein